MTDATDSRPLIDLRFEGSEAVLMQAGSSLGPRVKIQGMRCVRSERGRALSFVNAGDHLVIPHAPALNPALPLTIEVRAKGHGAPLVLDELPAEVPTREPFFQVVDDWVYFATNTDIAERQPRPRLVDWYVVTGRMHANGSGFEQRRRTFGPPFGIEPKLQVVGDRVYYEWFGAWSIEPGAPPERRWDQIYTASSNLDGADWQVLPRIDYRKGSRGWRTEQGAMQVVDGHIHYAFPRSDEDGRWQLWTARSRLDGTGWCTQQRTTDGGWVPEMQAMGGHIYYLHARYKPDAQDRAFICRGDLDGGNWRVLRELRADFRVPWMRFLVGPDRLWLSYADRDPRHPQHGRLWTGVMSLDGKDLDFQQRTDGELPAYPGRMQFLGDRIFYKFSQSDGRHQQMWTAESDLDGNGWSARQRTFGDFPFNSGFKEFQIVGGRTYVSGCAWRDRFFDLRPLFGSAGGNLIAKGDAMGLGLTEDNVLRGFVNLGQDHLHRGQTLEDSLPSMAEAALDDAWHTLTLKLDGKTLSLLVDGQLRCTTTLHSPPHANASPWVIGEGFRGLIDRVRVSTGPAPA